MNARLTAGLGIALCYGILSIWITARWAWALFQVAIFTLCALGLRSPIPRWTAAVIAIPLWGIVQISAGATVYAWQTWNSVLDWTTWLAVFLLSSSVLAQDHLRRRFLRALVLFAFAVSVISAVQMFTANGRILWLFPSGFTDYVLGPFVSRNHYAMFIELVLPVAAWEALRTRSPAWMSMASVMFASVVACASRAGGVLALAEILAVLILGSRSIPPRARIRVAGVFAASTMLLLLVVGWRDVWGRLRVPDPYGARRELLLSSAAMIRDHPWMGTGLGAWSLVYPRYALYDDGTFVNQAHSDWAQWAAEGGLPCLLVMLALAIVTVPRAIRSVWGLGLMAVWLHALVDYPFRERPILAAWFFTVLAAVHKAER